MIKEGIKISFCCNKCNKRLFDYQSGSFDIEMKCDRCKRVLRLKRIDEHYVSSRAIAGKLLV